MGKPRDVMDYKIKIIETKRICFVNNVSPNIYIFHNTPIKVEHGGYKIYQHRLCIAQNAIFQKNRHDLDRYTESD